MSRFPWGRTINTFVYDFDGVEVTIIKFHPFYEDNTRKPDMEKIKYHCEEINQSADSLLPEPSTDRLSCPSTVSAEPVHRETLLALRRDYAGGGAG